MFEKHGKNNGNCIMKVCINLLWKFLKGNSIIMNLFFKGKIEKKDKILQLYKLLGKHLRHKCVTHFFNKLILIFSNIRLIK